MEVLGRVPEVVEVEEVVKVKVGEMSRVVELE